jgi:hypothetical protein
MIVRSFLFLLLFISLAFIASGQDLNGQWKGKIQLGKGKKALELNVQLELSENDRAITGLLYFRGLDNNVIIGCDYIIQGRIVKNDVLLTPVSIQRETNMQPSGACINFVQLELKADASNTLSGNWKWLDGMNSMILFSKTDSVISSNATDEILTYFKGKYQQYDSLGFILEPANRLSEVVETFATTSKDLVLDVSSMDRSGGDSLSIYLNGEQIISPRIFTSKPIRIKVQLPEPADVEIVFVSESLVHPRAAIVVVLRDGATISTRKLTATGSRNPILLIKRSKE